MTTPTRRRMRSTSISLGITALMASSLTGCASSADYAAVCVDPDTQERVADDQCDDDSDYNGTGAGFFWYYLAARSVVPGVGRPRPAAPSAAAPSTARCSAAACPPPAARP